MPKINIAIDGYSSCGKSTLAKQLAERLGYTYIDSGAMYRATTLYFIKNEVNITNITEVNKALENISIQLLPALADQAQVLLNGIDVSDEIRQLPVAQQVSQVAAIKEVRQFAVAQQQMMGESKGVVMDGRDIGTVVFPNAALKIFVTADIKIRTERRYHELLAKDSTISRAAVEANLLQRDHIDTTRKESPLTQSSDALVLDNSKMTKSEQLKIALEWALERIG